VAVAYNLETSEYVRLCVLDDTLTTETEKSISFVGKTPKLTTIEVVGDTAIIAVSSIDVFYVLKADLPTLDLAPYLSSLMT